MNAATLQKLVRKSFELVDLVPHNGNKHFSYILRKNKVLSVGWNIITKTDPLSWRYKYEFPFTHSETMAIRNFGDIPITLAKCDLVNIRIGKKQNVAIAKPCEDCMRLLAAFSFRDVYFTNERSEFEKL